MLPRQNPISNRQLDLVHRAMRQSDFDTIILGQGLAGTTLAWNLRWQGCRVLVVDRDRPDTSSQVAAGLMTPITGQRLVQSWRWDQFWEAAAVFYRQVEVETSATFFEPRKMIRLLATESERGFLQRRINSEIGHLIQEPHPPLDLGTFDAHFGGFEMHQGGRLNVAAFLQASRQIFDRNSQFAAADICLKTDIELAANRVCVKPLNVSAERLIFCQGIDAIDNPWFQHIRFKPAKGEILTVRIRGLREQRIIHRGVWLMPLGDELFRVGATYEWSQLDSVPTVAGRDELCSRLHEFLRLPVEVIAHDAAVRPILKHQYPVIGTHPDQIQLGYFNGLGSKGSLQAPWLARHFANILTRGETLDPEVDMHHYEPRVVRTRHRR